MSDWHRVQWRHLIVLRVTVYGISSCQPRAVEIPYSTIAYMSKVLNLSLFFFLLQLKSAGAPDQCTLLHKLVGPDDAIT